MSPFFKPKSADPPKNAEEDKRVVLHYVEAEIPQTEQTSLQRYKQLKQLLNECFAYHKKQNKIETEEEKILSKINDPEEPKTEGALLKIIAEAFYSDNPKQNLKSNLPGYIDHVLCEYFEIKDKIASQFMIKRKYLDAHPPKIQPTYNQILRTVKHELVANKFAPGGLTELQELKSMAIPTKPQEFKHHMIDTIQSYLDSNEGGSDGKTRANTLMRQIEAAKSTEEVSAIITASLNNRKGLLKDSKQLKGRILHALCELNGLTEEMIDIVQYEACKDDWANYPKHMFSSSKEFKQTRNAAMLHVYEVDQSEKQFQKDSNLRGRVNSR